MKRVITILAVLAAGANLAAFAQDINPTVTVINTYEGEASGIVKPAQPIHIPDSVSRFNLDFDYSVFESPYKGSYDFKPYSVQIRPRATVTKDGKLYIKAGAGYTLRPDLHLVYTPLQKENLTLDIFASHESYFGNLWNYEAPVAGDVTFKADPANRTAQGAKRGISDAGVRLVWNWTGLELNASAAWNNVFGSIDRGMPYSHMANYGTAQVGLNSVGRKADYGFNLKVRSGVDASAGGFKLAATEVQTGVAVGGFELGSHSLFVDADAGFQFLGIGADSFNGRVSLVPHDIFEFWDWKFDIGVCVSALFAADKTAAALPGEAAHTVMFSKGGQWLYPRVTVTRPFTEALILEAGATGGDSYASYWDFVQEHPYLGMFNSAGVILDNTVEKLNVWAGVRGLILGAVQYGLKGGYRLVDNDLMWKAVPDPASMPDMLPHIGYGNYNQAYANLITEWTGKSFAVKGDYEFAKSWIRGNDFFAPSLFKGSLEASYHWGERIRSGVRVSGATPRIADMAGAKLTIPGYVDLGLYGEFQWRRNLSFWLNAGNLLNQTIMIDPFVAERGVTCTAGVIWKL